MSPLPDAGTPEPSAEDDYARVLEMMGSPQMQRRLEEARAQREKVLAEKAAARPPEAQDPRVRLAWDRELGSVGAAGIVPLQGEVPALPWLEEALEPVPAAAPTAAPAPAEPDPEPVAPRGWLRSRASGVGLGLVAGLALGTGLTWLAQPAPFDLVDAPEEAAVAVALPGPSALDVAPSLALAATASPPAVPPAQRLADGPPGRDAPARLAEPGGKEGAPVSLTGAAPVNAALELPPFPAGPGPEAGAQATAAGLSAMVPSGPLPALAVPPSSDARPLGQEVPPGPRGGLVSLDWQVALHLPPRTSPDALREAQEALRAVGVGLIVGTGASRFGVARSEVRFFHGDDASDAARIAAAMGAQARDFSAYRPIPPPGSFEVWLVED